MVIKLSPLKNDVKEKLAIVILCAGEGTRLKHITKTIPKPLIKIKHLKNISILHYLIINLIKLEIKRIGIVIGHLGSSIRQFISTIEINNPPIKDKLTIIDSKDQYRLGSLYSLLSITKNRYFFTPGTHYLILPGDTIFDFKLLEDVLTKILGNFNSIQDHPLVFYRKIKSKKLKETFRLDRLISIADITQLDSEAKLKRISQSRLMEIPSDQILNQLIPIIMLSYENINEIQKLNQEILHDTIWKTVNEFVFRGKKVLSFEIKKIHKFYDIDYESDLKNLKKKRKGQ
jgi:NDP-sugar pyrophosphorylase family protein